MPERYVAAIRAQAEARGKTPAEIVMRLVERAGLVDGGTAPPPPRPATLARRTVTPRFKQ